MKTSSVLAFITFLVGSIAAPTGSDLERRADPSFVPVDLLDLPSSSYKCGDDTFASTDIIKAAAWGTLLENAGETRGKESYPHQYNNYNNEVVLSSKCVAGDPNMKEYPLISGSPYYNGGKNNRNAGDHRVVYLHNNADFNGVDSNPISTFCGVMTHKGAEKGKFVLCTVV